MMANGWKTPEEICQDYHITMATFYNRRDDVLVILIIGMQLFATVVKELTLMKIFGRNFFVIEVSNIELDS